MVYEFKFPDVGEGVHEGTLVKWLVKEGDAVKEDQVVAEVETDKAVVEVPSPRSGTIADLKFKEGDTIKVGEVMFEIDERGAGGRAPKKEKNQRKKRRQKRKRKRIQQRSSFPKKHKRKGPLQKKRQPHKRSRLQKKHQNRPSHLQRPGVACLPRPQHESSPATLASTSQASREAARPADSRQTM